MPYYIKSKPKSKTKSKSSLRTLERKLDEIFSIYIRLRDSKAFGHQAFKCISCGKVKPIAQADCGHYMSRTHKTTRFDEDNCHAECRYCNRMSADHLVGYRANLINKLGRDECARKKIPPTYSNIRKYGEQRVSLVEMRSRQTTNSRDYEYKIAQLIPFYKVLVAKMKSE